MIYKVKIKTGFYKTTTYNLSMQPGVMYLIPTEEDTHATIEIKEEDIDVITLIKKKRPRFEIQTSNQILDGVLYQDRDYEELGKQFQENINKKIVFEQ